MKKKFVCFLNSLSLSTMGAKFLCYIQKMRDYGEIPLFVRKFYYYSNKSSYFFFPCGNNWKAQLFTFE